MDVLVMLEESPNQSPVLAHVNTAPSSLAPQRAPRDVVTLYGVPNVELLALALAAAVESHRTGAGHENVDAIRHLGVWAERRAITVSLGPIIGLTAPVFAPLESVLDRLREADALAFDYDGD